MRAHSDLSGVWSGAYRYDGGGEPVAFTAWIDERAGHIEGTTLEPASFGNPSVAEYEAAISGMRESLVVRFEKIYASTTGADQPPLIYEGVTDRAFETVTGTWRFAETYALTGTFRMRRASQALRVAVARGVLVAVGR